jgi:hypothetical protein
LGVGRKADDLVLLKEITFPKSKEMETGCNPADSSKGHYG